jgi:hypothetical protein
MIMWRRAPSSVQLSKARRVRGGSRQQNFLCHGFTRIYRDQTRDGHLERSEGMFQANSGPRKNYLDVNYFPDEGS